MNTVSQQRGLKPLVAGTERARRMATLGGSQSTDKKKFAASLRELKKKGLTNENAKKLADLIEDPLCSALDIQNWMQLSKVNMEKPMQQMKWAEVAIQLHKAKFGEKLQTENVHHVVNWNGLLKEIMNDDKKET